NVRELVPLAPTRWHILPNAVSLKDERCCAPRTELWPHEVQPCDSMYADTSGPPKLIPSICMPELFGFTSEARTFWFISSRNSGARTAFGMLVVMTIRLAPLL